MKSLITIVLAGILFACDQPAQPTPAAPATQPSGQQAACLPCGGKHVFDVTDKTAHAEVDGKTHYFCSDRCQEVFLKDPTKYLKPQAANDK